MSKYCSNCGNEVNENAVVCVKCGCALPKNTAYNLFNRTSATSDSIVNTIAQRIKTNGIIWIIIGIIQILLGISFNWVLLIIGVVNLISSVKDLNYSKEFPKNPIGIIEKMKPLGEAIFTLIYNLLFGGIIGVAGSIYYLIAVRGFVLENEQLFLDIENKHLKTL